MRRKPDFEFQRRVVSPDGKLISYGREVQAWLEQVAARKNENALALLKKNPTIKLDDLNLAGDKEMTLGILEGKFGSQKDYGSISPIMRMPDLSVDHFPTTDLSSEKTFYFTLMIDGISLLIGFNTCVGLNEGDDFDGLVAKLEGDDLLPGERLYYENLFNEYKKMILMGLLLQANQS